MQTNQKDQAVIERQTSEGQAVGSKVGETKRVVN